MKPSTALPTFPMPEGRKLLGPVPLDFELFYRSQLRVRAGRRIRSADLAARYHAWAAAAGADQLGFKDIRRAMLNIGHRHKRSNGMLFLDVDFAEASPRVADNFPSAREELQTGQVAALINRVDTLTTKVVAELVAMRASLDVIINQPGAK